jgi:hypothetical protein
LETNCQCAAVSCIRDESRASATDLQEHIANHLNRLWLKALIVSVTEMVLLEASGVD